MTNTKTLFATILLASAATSSAAVLSYDDGTAESGFGAGSASAIWMVRYATPTPGVTQVSEIGAMFGSAALPGQSGGNGVALTFGVWSDPNGDGNPTDGLLLAFGPGVTASVDTNTVVTFTFGAPVTVATNNFFVGYALPGNGGFPASLDTGTPIPNTSWGFIGTDINTLGNNGAPFDLNTISPGNVIIRATVVPEPGSMMTLGAAGLLGMMRRRRRA